MAIVFVIDLPTWLVATAGACALAVLVWQGRAQAARRDSEGAPDAVDEGAPDAVDEWYVVAEGAPDAVDEAAPVVGEGAPEVAPAVGEGTPENGARPDLVELAQMQSVGVGAMPVAWHPPAAPVADTTPALYYYTPNGLRVHTTHTCWGLRNAKAIFVSPTCELRGKTRCNVCFLR